ncbi:MAG: hypothetical protein LRY73_15555 [Bacillus sp. (in: Bacteria)]|nr:hypothetical protein [Bacillus sp. (in: firmicutes)]
MNMHEVYINEREIMKKVNDHELKNVRTKLHCGNKPKAKKFPQDSRQLLKHLKLPFYRKSLG